MKNISKLIITIALLGLLPATGKDVKKTTGMTAEMSASSPSKTKVKAKIKPDTKSKATARITSATQKDTKAVLSSTEESRLLSLLNEGTADDLSAIKGIAGTRAESIVSARPFQSIYEVILVPGVGDATFERILAHGKKLTLPVQKSAKS